MPFTTLALNGMLDAWVAAEGTLYVALIRTGGTEATGVGAGGIAYARKSISFSAAAAGNKTNSTDIVWDNGGATDWSSDIDKWKVYDLASGGNELANGNLTATRDMSIANATLTVAAGDLDFDLT